MHGPSGQTRQNIFLLLMLYLLSPPSRQQQEKPNHPFEIKTDAAPKDAISFTETPNANTHIPPSNSSEGQGQDGGSVAMIPLSITKWMTAAATTMNLHPLYNRQITCMAVTVMVKGTQQETIQHLRLFTI